MADVTAQAHQSERALAIVTHEGWVAMQLQPGRWEERYCVLQPIDGLYLFHSESDASEWLSTKEEALKHELRPEIACIDDLAVPAQHLYPAIDDQLSKEATEVTDGEYNTAIVLCAENEAQHSTIIAVVESDYANWFQGTICSRAISTYLHRCQELGITAIPTLLHDLFTDFPKFPSLVRLAVTPRDSENEKQLPKGFQPAIITEKSARALSSYLEQLQENAKLLILDRVHLDNDTVSLLLPGLSACTSIIGLSAERNAIGDGGAGFIAQSLYATGALKTIHLSRNRIGDIGAVHLANLIVCKPTLLSIRLAWNNISASGARALGHAVERSMLLQDLDLSHNPLGEQGFRSICQALTGALALRTINLSHCGAVDGSIDHLVAAIKRHKERALGKGLEGIWLDGNHFTGRGIQTIKAAIAKTAKNVFVSVEPQPPHVHATAGSQEKQTTRNENQMPMNGAKQKFASKGKRSKSLSILVPSPSPYSPESSTSNLENTSSLLRLTFDDSVHKPLAKHLAKSIAIYLGIMPSRVTVADESAHKVDLSIARDPHGDLARKFVQRHQNGDPSLVLLRVGHSTVVRPVQSAPRMHVSSVGSRHLTPQAELPVGALPAAGALGSPVSADLESEAGVDGENLPTGASRMSRRSGSVPGPKETSVRAALGLDMDLVHRRGSQQHTGSGTPLALSHLPSSRVAVSGERHFEPSDGPGPAPPQAATALDPADLGAELTEALHGVLWAEEAQDDRSTGPRGQSQLPQRVARCCKHIARTLAASDLAIPALASGSGDPVPERPSTTPPGSMRWTDQRYRRVGTVLPRHTQAHLSPSAKRPAALSPPVALALTLLTQYAPPQLNTLRLYAAALTGNDGVCTAIADKLSLGHPPLDLGQHVEILEALAISACVAEALPRLETALERHRALQGAAALETPGPQSEVLQVAKLYLRMAYETLAEEQLLAVRLKPAPEVARKVRLDASAWELTEFPRLAASPHVVLHFQSQRHAPLTVYVHASQNGTRSLGAFAKAHASASRRMFATLVQVMRRREDVRDGARVAAAHEAVGIAIANRGSADELFCQLACQLIGTPADQSQETGWRLMVALVRLLAPSPPLGLCLIKLCGRLWKHCKVAAVKPLIYWALHELKRAHLDASRTVLDNGSTPFAKDVDVRFTVLRDILCDVPCAVQVYLPGGSMVKCEARYLMSFKQLLHHIHKRLSSSHYRQSRERQDSHSTLLQHGLDKPISDKKDMESFHETWDGFRFFAKLESTKRPLDWQDDVAWFVWCNDVLGSTLKDTSQDTRHKTLLSLELEVAPIPDWSLCRLDQPQVRASLLFRQQHKLFLDGMMCATDPQAVGYLAALAACIDLGLDRYAGLPRDRRLQEAEKNLPPEALARVGHPQSLRPDHRAFLRSLRETVALVDAALVRRAEQAPDSPRAPPRAHALKAAYLGASTTLALAFARFYPAAVLSMALGGTKARRELVPEDTCLAISKHGLALLSQSTQGLLWAAGFPQLAAVDAVNNVLRVQARSAPGCPDDLISLRLDAAAGVHQTVMRHARQLLVHGGTGETHPDLFFLQFDSSFPDLPLPPAPSALATPAGQPVLAWPVRHPAAGDEAALPTRVVASVLAREWAPPQAAPGESRASWMVREGASVVQSITGPAMEAAQVSTRRPWRQAAPLPPSYPPPGHSPQVDRRGTGLALTTAQGRAASDESERGTVVEASENVLEEVAPPDQEVQCSKEGEDVPVPPFLPAPPAAVSGEKYLPPVSPPVPPPGPPPPQANGAGVPGVNGFGPREVPSAKVPSEHEVPSANVPSAHEVPSANVPGEHEVPGAKVPGEHEVPGAKVPGEHEVPSALRSNGTSPMPPSQPPPPAGPPPSMERDFEKPPGPPGRKPPSRSPFKKQDSEHADFFREHLKQ